MVTKDMLEQNTLERREALLLAAELVTGGELQRHLGLSSQALNELKRCGMAFSVDGKDGAQYYPAFLCDQSLNLRKVKAVSHALGSLSGASKWLFFTMRRTSLGGASPLDIIRVKHATVGEHTSVTTPRAVRLDDVLRAASAAADKSLYVSSPSRSENSYLQEGNGAYVGSAKQPRSAECSGPDVFIGDHI